MAYVYPREMRATRDLLRRRCHFPRKCAELLTHIQNTASQYLLPTLGKIAYHGNRGGVAEQFHDPEVLVRGRGDDVPSVASDVRKRVTSGAPISAG